MSKFLVLIPSDKYVFKKKEEIRNTVRYLTNLKNDNSYDYNEKIHEN